MVLDGRFERAALGGQVPLYFFASDKFKTVLLRVYLHQPLAADTVTPTALLPDVLLQGCEGFPTHQAIQRHLDRLYGANLSAGVQKVGETQNLYIQMEVADDRFLPSGEEVLGEAAAFLWRILLRPLLEGGRFRSDYVEREKKNLASRLDGLRNDKIQYAAFRCSEEMCRGEPYALHVLGRKAALADVDAASLTSYYREFVRSRPISVFAVGRGPASHVAEVLARALDDALATAAGAGSRWPLPPLVASDAPARPERTVVEEDTVHQAKLVVGCRTDTTRADPAYAALAVYNGLLGGFAHSKLFRNVREKASLAYYARSGLDLGKGLLFISCGIDGANFPRALAIIRQQMEDMQHGRFSEEELETTRRMIVNQVRMSLDSPGALISQALEEMLAGVDRTAEERLRAVQAVTADDVVAVAERVRVDTVYLLRGDQTEPRPQSGGTG
ncbi:MAG: insulinase family protein [Clostridia bacterium]|nr:insulinase family protein [Clostridia bacterium]